MTGLQSATRQANLGLAQAISPSSGPPLQIVGEELSEALGPSAPDSACSMSRRGNGNVGSRRKRAAWCEVTATIMCPHFSPARRRRRLAPTACLIEVRDGAYAQRRLPFEDRFVSIVVTFEFRRVPNLFTLPDHEKPAMEMLRVCPGRRQDRARGRGPQRGDALRASSASCSKTIRKVHSGRRPCMKTPGVSGGSENPHFGNLFGADGRGRLETERRELHVPLPFSDEHRIRDFQRP
jgi:hypothetical protein